MVSVLLIFSLNVQGRTDVRTGQSFAWRPRVRRGAAQIGSPIAYPARLTRTNGWELKARLNPVSESYPMRPVPSLWAVVRGDRHSPTPGDDHQTPHFTQGTKVARNRGQF